MTDNLLDQDLTALFGLDELSPEDRETFLEDVGALIMESVLTKLSVDMSDEERTEFETLLAGAQDPQEVLSALEEKYPAVTDIFKQEVEAFREEAVAVMGESFDA